MNWIYEYYIVWYEVHVKYQEKIGCHIIIQVFLYDRSYSTSCEG